MPIREIRGQTPRLWFRLPILLTTDPADERRYKREELKAETAPLTLRAPVKEGLDVHG